MAGYIRQSTFVDGDTITAALFNNEYNQLVNAFSNTTGHKHDGTTAEGPVIGLIGDAGETSPNNKVLIDTTNNYIEFYVEVSSAPVQQLYIADGAIIPVTDNDIDLGTSSLEFKDIYIDGTATIDTLTVDEAATVGTTLGVTGATTLSSTLAVTGTSTLTGNVTATNDLSVGGNLTVTGNATISGNLTFGDADTDSINLAAEIDSDIIPNTDGTYDLGSATKEWQDLYIDGTANIDSLIADTADINGGTIDGATIATSDITVGAGKTLDVSSGTLTLADDQISGDKVEGGTIAATTVTTLTSTTGNITNVNATTVDSTNLEVTNLKAKDGTAAGSIADSTGVVTLASSVLTTTDINGGTIDGTTIATSDITVGTGKTLDVSSGTLTLADNQISGDKVEGGTIAATTITALTYGSLSDGTITITAFADEDDMSSDSATLVPTQQSVKAYVDSQVTAQDLDFQGDSGGALSIDLDSETLTIAGGTGIDTTGATNTLTVAIDSTVATLTGTQTLTNKTLTTPVISSISNTGTLTLPTSTDTLVGRATTDTLTNKTLTSATLTSPVINTSVSGTAFLDDDTFATATASTLASSESIKAYVDAEVGAIVTDIVSDTTPQLGGNLDLNSSDITGTGNINITGTVTASDLEIDSGTLSVDSTNNRVGIGETSPLGKLHIKGSDTGATASAQGNSLILEDTENGLSILSSTAGAGYINFGDSDDNDVGMIIYGHSSNAMQFFTNAAERMRIDSSGNVGIGTSSPNAYSNVTTLTVNGAVQGRLDCAYSGTLGGSFLAVSGETQVKAVGSSNVMTFEVNNAERMRIDTSGNVLVGTSTLTPNYTGGIRVHSASSVGNIRVSAGAKTGFDMMADSGGNGYLVLRDAADMSFHTSDAEKMRIHASGCVGIGSTVDRSLGTGIGTLVINGTGGGGLWLSDDDSSATTSKIYSYTNGSVGELVINQGTGVGGGNIDFTHNDSTTPSARITSSGQLLINRYTSGLTTFPTAPITLGGGAFSNTEKTMIHFDDMGQRGLGTAQTIDFSMGRTAVTPDASKAQIVALMEGNSATSASHGIGWEFRTATGDTQATPIKVVANGSLIKFNTTETPQSGNPRTGQAIVIGPSTQGAITQGLTSAAVLQNRSGELYAIDSSHNNTQLTPHNWTLISDGPSEELAWTYWSQRPNPDNPDQLQSINVDIAKVARKVEDLVGEKLVYTENSNMDSHTHQTIIADIQSTLADLTTRIEALEG